METQLSFVMAVETCPPRPRHIHFPLVAPQPPSVTAPVSEPMPRGNREWKLHYLGKRGLRN